MKRIWIFCLTLFTTMNVLALSLEETALNILKGSRQYASEELSFTAVSESLSTQGNLPDPRLDGEFLAAPAGETDRWGAEVSWELEWPGVYNARKKEADLRVLAARKNLEANRSQKLADIKILLLDYILYTRKLALLEEMKSANDSITLFAERASKAGEITILDLNKIKLEGANIYVAHATLVNDLSDVISGLNIEYGGDVSGLLSQMPVDFPPIEIPDAGMIRNLVEKTAEVEYARTEAEVARQGKSVASMEALPSLSVGYKHAFEDGIHFNGATIGLSVPLFSSHNKQKAAKAAIAEAENKLDLSRESTLIRINETLKRVGLIKDQIEKIEPVLMNTDHSALLLKAYEKGVISLIDYLTERNYFANAAMDFLSLKHEAAVTLIELNKYSPELNKF